MQVQGRDPGLGCVGLGGSVEGAGSLGRENLEVFQHQRHRPSRGNRGAGGEEQLGEQGSSCLSIGQTWQSVSSTRVAPAQFHACASRSPQMQQCTQLGLFSSFSGCDDVNIPSCVSKKRK